MNLFGKKKRKHNVKPQYVKIKLYHPEKDLPNISQETKPVEQPQQTNAKKQDPRREFLKTFKELTYHRRPWDIWNDFVTMFACALSNPFDKGHYDEREALYLKTINQYDKQEQRLFPELAAYTVLALEENPEQDFLGGMFMELNLGDKKNGQIFTPYHLCDLMARIAGEDVISVVKEKGYVTISDPCCGSGATLIAGIHEARKQLEKENLNFQNHVFVTAQDIDFTVAMMCYIQLSLLGVASYVKVGNTITEPISKNDSLENYWFTMMYFSPVWKYRRALRELNSLTEGEAPND